MTASLLLMSLALPNSLPFDDHQIGELAVAVQELAAGQPFEPPVFVTLGRDAFERSAAQVLQPSGDAQGVMHYVSMYYDRAGNQIVARDDIRLGEAIARRGCEVEPLSRLLVLHEIVHAWQARNAAPLLDQVKDLDRLVMQALLEGHAEYIVARYCERCGQSYLYDRISTHRRRFQRLQLSRAIVDLHFVYEEGLQFWKFVRGRGAIGFDDIVAKLPTQRQIANPVEYESAVGENSLDWLIQHPQLIHDNSTRAIRPNDLGFVAFRTLVQTLPNSPDDRRRIIEAYRSVAQFRSDFVVVTGTQFCDPAAARLFYQALVGQHSTHGRVTRTSEQEEIVHAAHRADGKAPQQQVTTILLRDEASVIEVNDFRPESQEADLPAWIDQAVKEYLAARMHRLPETAGPE